MHARGRLRRIGWAVAIAGVALLAASCVTTSDATQSNEAALPFGSAGNPEAAAETIEIDTLDAMRFEPASVAVERGDTILFVVTNDGRLPHEFTIGDDAEQERHAREMAEMGTMPHDHPFSVWLEPGETKEVAWEFGVAGEFSYACHVAGHYEAGMVGSITVE